MDHRQGLRDGVEELVKLCLHRGSVGLVVDRVSQGLPAKAGSFGAGGHQRRPGPPEARVHVARFPTPLCG